MPVPVQQSAKCETCGHTESAHHTIEYLDERWPGAAPHRTEHCTSCCDPEDANSDVCSHNFKPVAPRKSIEEARARVGGSIGLNTNRNGVPIMEWDGRDAELDALTEAVRRECK